MNIEFTNEEAWLLARLVKSFEVNERLEDAFFLLGLDMAQEKVLREVLVKILYPILTGEYK